MSTTSVGIVLVSFNSSAAVRLTLDSLQRARTGVSHKVILVDNASEQHEREAIRRAFDDVAGQDWQFIQSDINLGFSGGNNLGISRFLDDESISHVCLLNADTVVTDHWLDRLVATGLDAVSPVTNKADSDQFVPVDYEMELRDAMDEDGRLSDAAFGMINDFAARRHTVFAGNLAEAEPTFFCVLLSRKLMEDVGLLDETFFPGGFEDDDYCLRAKALGYRMHLVRDVFIQHWGSASFSRIDYGYFQAQSAKNRGYLEEKHGITWRIRPQKGFASYCQDLFFLLRKGPLECEGRHFESLFRSLLDAYVDTAGKEHHALVHKALSLGEDPQSLGPCLPDLKGLWSRFTDLVDQALDPGSDIPEYIRELERDAGPLEECIRDTVEANVAVNARILSREAAATVADEARTGLWTRLTRPLRLARKGLGAFFHRKGIVILGGYCFPEREKDGYFQRIAAVDGLFEDALRVYVDFHPRPDHEAVMVSAPAPSTIILHYQGSRRQKALVGLYAAALAIRYRRMYFHSVLAMWLARFPLLLRWPGMRGVVDIHGVVPEEFRYHGDFYCAVLTEKAEEYAVRHARYVVVVTETMGAYLRDKYRERFRADLLVFPILPPGLDQPWRQKKRGKPVTVYAGGVQKWQLGPRMAEAIDRQPGLCRYEIYTPDTGAFTAMLSDKARKARNVTVGSKTHHELLQRYPDCHYGFILRDDVVVNHVACPTKLVEYLAMGIVPIVSCAAIGDFAAKGMRSVSLEDFERGQLPPEAERRAMAEDNQRIYHELRKTSQEGSRRLREGLFPLHARGIEPLRSRFAAVFPPRTLPYRAARQVYRMAKALPYCLRPGRENFKTAYTTAFPPGTRAYSLGRKLYRSLVPAAVRQAEPRTPPPVVEAAPEVSVTLPDVRPVDILFQVENFLKGGLENVVLDLMDTFREAGHAVALLVLGQHGEAARLAGERGFPVWFAAYDPDRYGHILDAARPSVVFSHYSTSGAALAEARGMAFVQVIHNSYMWFTEEQMEDFRQSIPHTALFIAVSLWVSEYSTRRLGVPEDKIQVIPNGIDLARFSRPGLAGEGRALRREHGYTDTDFVFLSVAGITFQKNPLGLVQSFHAALPSCPDAQLAMLGPVYIDSLQADIMDYCREHGLQDRVRYLGQSVDPAPFYAMADAFAHAAFFEGGQLCFLEALAMNLPCVSTDVGFCRHFHGQQGIWLAPPPVDIITYRGTLSELAPTARSTQELAGAFKGCYAFQICPDLDPEARRNLDRQVASRAYLQTIGRLVTGKPPQSFVEPLPADAFGPSSGPQALSTGS